MRLNIDIDDELLRKVMRDGNYPTKKAAVEDALYVIVHGRLKPRPATPDQHKKSEQRQCEQTSK